VKTSNGVGSPEAIPRFTKAVAILGLVHFHSTPVVDSREHHPQLRTGRHPTTSPEIDQELMSTAEPEPAEPATHRWSRCRPDCDLAPLSPRHLFLRTAGRGPAWPGLLLTAIAVAVSFAVSGMTQAINAATVAVLLGVLVSNLGLHRPALRAGTHVASHRLLRIAVVLLGLQLGFPQLQALGLGGLVVVVVTVAVTFVGTQLVGRLLRLSQTRTLLIATGFSICGASAVAAMSDVADADEDDIAVAIALVTLCGSLAIVLLPFLQHPLHLDAVGFGSWVGASVHDVGQTVATASRVDGALDAAVVVKLSRVILLAPLVAAVGLHRRHAVHRDADATGAGRRRRPPIVPLFVVGFLVAVAVSSTGWLPATVLHQAQFLQEVLLVAALFGLGTTISLQTLRRTGGPALVLGLLSWMLVAATAYLGVILLDR
jgi:uncharacterized integral membrane protein (TIGR00698 family)